MMGAIFGPQKDRVKVDLRLPKDLHKQVHEICVLLGIPKNAFFALSAGLLLMELSLLQKVNKREKAGRIAASIVQKVLDSFPR